MQKFNKGEITDVDNWRRYQCISMPMHDNTRCITPDGLFERCNKCRYHVENHYREK